MRRAVRFTPCQAAPLGKRDITSEALYVSDTLTSRFDSGMISDVAFWPNRVTVTAQDTIKNFCMITSMVSGCLRRTVASLALVGMGLLLAGCGEEERGAEPLRMICEATFPPYEYHVQGGIDGIDPALCTIIAKCLDRPLEVQDMAFDAVIPAVATGKADIAASGLTVTPERARQVRFSEPYVEAAQVAVVPVGSPIRSPADLKGRRIGVQSGSTGDLYVTRTFGEPERFQNVIFAATAALTGKVDVSVVDRQPAQVFVAKTPGLRILPEPVSRETYALAFRRDNALLCAQADAILAAMRANGTLETLIARYTDAMARQREGSDEAIGTRVDVSDLVARMATDPALRAALDALEARADELVAEARPGLWRRLAANARANFVEGGRWRYLAEGFAVTLEIAALATLLGLLIGFGVATVRATCDMTGRLRVADALCRVYLTVIRGTPVVVQLLILYFVIFGSQDVSKVFVAVVAFGLNSGAYVAEIVRGGIMAIDRGQTEAGRSLGLSHGRTMLFVILPQALRNVLPALGNEFIVLLKETSVAGYIALMDLTKAGDIIRSQTYTAFMPLLAVAAIYLAAVSLFAWLLGKLERRLTRHG